MNEFVSAGLTENSFEEYFDKEDAARAKIPVLYTRP